MTFVALAPAKINLTLDVGPPAADGYHSLRSVFLRLGLADRLTAELDTAAATDSLSVEGPPDCPVEGNLVLRALDALRRHVGQPLPSLRLQLLKQVPIAAGLGGGSSDAAAMIGLAEAGWGIGLSPAAKLAVALELGSDVPFFAADVPAALVEGRGEALTRLPGVKGGAGVLLAVNEVGMATGPVFARHDELTPGEPGGRVQSTTDDLVAAFRSGLDGGELCAWADVLRDANGLWPAALSMAPGLGELRDALELASGRPWMLTGSGSALYCLYASASEAVESGRTIAAELAASFDGTRLLADNLTAADPVWRYPA
ncbi:4-(cytidine 5'-diphospho)-2-C-methyl-D-erythritol kinase [soil metagenome]